MTCWNGTDRCNWKEYEAFWNSLIGAIRNSMGHAGMTLISAFRKTLANLQQLHILYHIFHTECHV